MIFTFLLYNYLLSVSEIIGAKLNNISPIIGPLICANTALLAYETQTYFPLIPFALYSIASMFQVELIGTYKIANDYIKKYVSFGSCKISLNYLKNIIMLCSFSIMMIYFIMGYMFDIESNASMSFFYILMLFNISSIKYNNLFDIPDCANVVSHLFNGVGKMMLLNIITKNINNIYIPANIWDANIPLFIWLLMFMTSNKYSKIEQKQTIGNNLINSFSSIISQAQTLTQNNNILNNNQAEDSAENECAEDTEEDDAEVDDAEVDDAEADDAENETKTTKEEATEQRNKTIDNIKKMTGDMEMLVSMLNPQKNKIAEDKQKLEESKQGNKLEMKSPEIKSPVDMTIFERIQYQRELRTKMQNSIDENKMLMRRYYLCIVCFICTICTLLFGSNNPYISTYELISMELYTLFCVINDFSDSLRGHRMIPLMLLSSMTIYNHTQHFIDNFWLIYNRFI